MTIDAQLIEKVQIVFREIFENPELTIFDAMQSKDVASWDSLNHVSLIMRLEEIFDVRFSTREVMGWKNVGELLRSLDQKVKEKK